jgi:hypothetical protein
MVFSDSSKNILYKDGKLIAVCLDGTTGKWYYNEFNLQACFGVRDTERFEHGVGMVAYRTVDLNPVTNNFTTRTR